MSVMRTCSAVVVSRVVHSRVLLDSQESTTHKERSSIQVQYIHVQ